MSGSRPRPDEDQAGHHSDDDGRSSTKDEARRRRIAEALGDVLPDRTADELPEGDERAAENREEWLRGQVPPHHG